MYSEEAVAVDLQVLLKSLSERILSILWTLLQNRGKGVIAGGKFSLGWEYKQAFLHKMQFRKWFLWSTIIRTGKEEQADI